MCMGATDGMIALQEFIGENLWILMSIIAIYFYVGLVLNIAEIQFTTSIGYQIGRSHAIEQAVGLTIMLGLAAAANELAPTIQNTICLAVTGGEGGTLKMRRLCEEYLSVRRFPMYLKMDGLPTLLIH